MPKSSMHACLTERAVLGGILADQGSVNTFSSGVCRHRRARNHCSRYFSRYCLGTASSPIQEREDRAGQVTREGFSTSDPRRASWTRQLPRALGSVGRRRAGARGVAPVVLVRGRLPVKIQGCKLGQAARQPRVLQHVSSCGPPVRGILQHRQQEAAQPLCLQQRVCQH